MPGHIQARQQRTLAVVGHIAVGDGALCVLYANGQGTVLAVLNANHAAQALEHAQAHLARGLDGPQVCTLDCPA